MDTLPRKEFGILHELERVHAANLVIGRPGIGETGTSLVRENWATRIDRSFEEIFSTTGVNHSRGPAAEVDGRR